MSILKDGIVRYPVCMTNGLCNCIDEGIIVFGSVCDRREEAMVILSWVSGMTVRWDRDGKAWMHCSDDRWKIGDIRDGRSRGILSIIKQSIA